MFVVISRWNILLSRGGLEVQLLRYPESRKVKEPEKMPSQRNGCFGQCTLIGFFEGYFLTVVAFVRLESGSGSG